MDTLTPLHDELDASLARILLDIHTQVLAAQWRLEDMYWEKDAWAFPSFRRIDPSFRRIDPSFRSWQEQSKLREKYRERKGINYALSDLLSGHAFDRVLGNEPWHFEFTPPRLPWWKRNALYRAFKRYRFARMYGASNRKALGL